MLGIKKLLSFWLEFVLLFALNLTSSAAAETLYVDSRIGNDIYPGTKEQPLCTINHAAVLVNNSSDKGPTFIRIAPGVYNFTNPVVFENTRPYTKGNRLIIEATVLPDYPQWKPALMPIILSTEDPRKPEKLGQMTGTYGLQIKISHVTIRGLKFLGNPLPNNWYNPVSRIGTNLEDLLVSQCLFVGDTNSLDIYCATLATGDKFVVDHCVFYNCHASVVFWDGPGGIRGKGNAMRYCIVDGGYISGVWTCQTAEDFAFHHNIVTRTEYFWMRKRDGKTQKYRLSDCVITDNKHYSGYGVESGPTGQTGPEIIYNEKHVIKEGEVALVKNKRARNYLHIVPGSLGSNLSAGLFKK